MCESAEYKAFKDCHNSLLTCIKQSPKDVCDHLLPFEILAPNDRDYLKNDHHDDGDKTRRILDAVLLQIKNDPQVFHSFVSALEAAGGFTKAGVQELKDALQRQHQQCDQSQRMEENRYENSPMSLLQPLPGLAVTEEAGSVFELPTMDDGDGGTLLDPLEHPPDDTEVGADLRAAATSRQVAPTVDSFGGRLLQTFQSEEIELVIKLLSQAESQSIDLIGVSDADGKTLLHLACRKNWMDWHGIVGSLVENHHCDVAAVDEDGNTPLHEAYQCGNLPSVEYLLSLPTCNPDAVNKHEYTVLRMALEKNDRKSVRNLLATGRVNPRKGSSCGHTYPELLAINQLQPQPQNYDGSALQMVTQFAKCMESSKCSICPPFTSYCLRDTLHKILKNRNQVSIPKIVDCIKENMLPLPANPDEIHDLLVDIQSLSDDFNIRTNELGELQVQRRDTALRYESYPVSLLQPFPMMSGFVIANETISVLELPTMGDGDGETLPDPLEHPPDDAEVGADLRAAATSRQEAPTVDSFEGRLLQTFQSGEFYQAIEILSKAECQSIDLRSVSDADGKTLLHLACRKGGVDWHHIVSFLR